METPIGMCVACITHMHQCGGNRTIIRRLCHRTCSIHIQFYCWPSSGSLCFARIMPRTTIVYAADPRCESRTAWCACNAHNAAAVHAHTCHSFARAHVCPAHFKLHILFIFRIFFRLVRAVVFVYFAIVWWHALRVCVCACFMCDSIVVNLFQMYRHKLTHGQHTHSTHHECSSQAHHITLPDTMNIRALVINTVCLSLSLSLCSTRAAELIFIVIQVIVREIKKNSKFIQNTPTQAQHKRQ